MRAVYFFEVNDTPKHNRVKVTALHLEGKAIQWHQGAMRTRGDHIYHGGSMFSFLFGTHAYDDPLVDIRNLQRVGP